MAAFQRVEDAGIDIAALLIGGDAGLLEHALGQRISEDQEFAGLHPVVFRRVGDLVEAVGDLVGERDRAVARQRPRRGGPDHHGCFRQPAEFRLDRKLHPHGIARVVLVLHFGFGQSGLFHHAPHHRLGAAIQRAVGGEFHQLAGDLRLREEVHGGIAAVPVADDAEPLEFGALHVEPAAGIGAAFLAERHHRGRILEVRLRLALRAVVLLLDLPFDRQAVAVPARHVVTVEAEHLLALGDDVLEDLVERVPDMDVAIGVGRAVMQHEFRLALRLLAQGAVEVDLLPAFQQLRLGLRQAGAHRKLGLRQEQRAGIIVGVGLRGVGFGGLVGHERLWLG